MRTWDKSVFGDKFKMAALFQLVKLFSRKREFLGCQCNISEEMAMKPFVRDMDFEIEALEHVVMSGTIVITKGNRNERGPNELRSLVDEWIPKLGRSRFQEKAKAYKRWIFHNAVYLFYVIRLLSVFTHTHTDELCVQTNYLS